MYNSDKIWFMVLNTKSISWLKRSSFFSYILLCITTSRFYCFSISKFKKDIFCKYPYVKIYPHYVPTLPRGSWFELTWVNTWECFLPHLHRIPVLSFKFRLFRPNIYIFILKQIFISIYFLCKIQFKNCSLGHPTPKIYGLMKLKPSLLDDASTQVTTFFAKWFDFEKNIFMDVSLMNPL